MFILAILLIIYIASSYLLCNNKNLALSDKNNTVNTKLINAKIAKIIIYNLQFPT